MPERSFARKVKEDLIRLPLRTESEIQSEIAFFFQSGGRPSGVKSEFPEYSTTSLGALAERIVGALRQIGFDGLAEKTVGRDKAYWYIYPLSSSEHRFTDFLRDFFAETSVDATASSEAERRAGLRGAFLSSGTITDPVRAYQVEFSLRNSQAADNLILLLHAENIEPSKFRRGDKTVVYFKDGSSVADFLTCIGAHSSRLHFESTRVDKEIRNSVNRMVNCDTANAKRQAEACARQTELLSALLQSGENGKIPPELLLAARVRVENPGMSLRDLGLLMNPQIGKSGMNHRLQKLEEIAREADLSP